MRVAYLDAFSGLSGDMTVGAFLDTGLPLAELEEELQRLDLGGYRIRQETRERSGIVAAKFVVEIEGEEPAVHTHGESGRVMELDGQGNALADRPAHHETPRSHRSYRDIRRMIEDSRLASRTRDLALRIFRRLAEAEGKVHGVDPEDVHFHEVGAIDSIVDVVGAAWGFASWDVEEVLVSRLPLGRGTVVSQHGRIPVPAPATMELLRGFPVRPGDGEGEMVTPTGAAIVAALAKATDVPPDLSVERIGYGAGDRELRDRPNLLRILIGERRGGVGVDDLVLLETNIDDMNPELYGYVMERLFTAGARDVYLTPIQMKKGRPAVLLSALCDPGLRDEIGRLLFSETTTLGVRVVPVSRLRIEREEKEVETKFGTVRVRIARSPDGSVNVAPEYEDCRRVAEQTRVPLKVVYREAVLRATAD